MSLDPALFPQILARWHRPARGECAESELHRGFSGAVVVRVRSDAGDLCLRGWPPNAPPAERIRGLHRLLAHVHATGVTQVPVPRPASDGDTLVELHDRWWQLEPWLPGTADFLQDSSDVRLKHAMAVLAAFHQAAWQFRPRAAEQPWFATGTSGTLPSVLERRRQLGEWRPPAIERVRQALSADGDGFARLGREILDHAVRLGPAIAAQLDAASRLTLPLGPCIRDVWHDHLLFTGDELTGLIDLSASRTDHVAADLARLLGSLCGDDARRWDTALDAYRQHRPLTLDELGLVPVLDRSGVLLSGLTWLKRRYLRQEPITDLDRVCVRLESIAARLKRMR